MIDFGDDGPSSAGLQNYYQRSAQNEEQEGEPEERKVRHAKATLLLDFHSLSAIWCLYIYFLFFIIFKSWPYCHQGSIEAYVKQTGHEKPLCRIQEKVRKVHKLLASFDHKALFSDSS